MRNEISESEKYADLSRQFIEKADEYLLAGDRVQASEKGCGAVAEAVKSIAEDRRRNHWGHHLLNNAVYQLSVEWNRPDILTKYDTVEKLHVNSYEDSMELDEIASRIQTAIDLLAELGTLKMRSPVAPVVENRGQRNRWRRLTGELLTMESEPNSSE